MENLEKYFIKSWEIFRKILKSMSKNFNNHFKKIWKISRNISEIFHKCVGSPKSKFPIFFHRHLTVWMLWKLGKYYFWDCGNTEFSVCCSIRMNRKSSMTNIELPIAFVCVPRAVIQFSTVKNTSAVEIHRQLTEVYGSDVMSVQMVKKWCQEFHKGRCEVYDGCPKVGTDESINTICTLFNRYHHLTLLELEMIMNNDLED